MENTRLYHLTNKKAAKKILRQGLLPKCGPFSRLTGETEKQICFTDRENLPKWQAVLGYKTHNALLSIPYTMCQYMEPVQYSSYTEFRSTKPVPTGMIRKEPLMPVPKPVMQGLCKECLGALSELCVEAFLPGLSKKQANALRHTLKAYARQVDVLDFSVLPAEEIKGWLQAYADRGNYSFCDLYLQAGKPDRSRTRLYEKLPENKDRTLRRAGRYLKKAINRKLGDTLRHFETGGFPAPSPKKGRKRHA